MLIMRASSMHAIMGEAKSIDPVLLDDATSVIARKLKKTDQDMALLRPLRDMTLSDGAKTYIEALAKEFVYEFEERIESKYLAKGIQCEDAAIQLYNDQFFTNHVKHTGRVTDEWFTGECDILVPDVKIIDIKNAWSLPTFPATVEQLQDITKKSGYDWQGRVYMRLYDVPQFEVAYCMVSTPDDVRRHEQESIHQIDHIDPALRITRWTIARDLKIEARMVAKVKAARGYFQQQIEQIAIDHS